MTVGEFFDQFDKEYDDELGVMVVWMAENGNLSSAPLSLVTNKFDGLPVQYEAFMSVVPPPTDTGATWGNHVRAWRDQGKFG